MLRYFSIKEVNRVLILDDRVKLSEKFPTKETKEDLGF